MPPPDVPSSDTSAASPHPSCSCVTETSSKGSLQCTATIWNARERFSLGVPPGWCGTGMQERACAPTGRASKAPRNVLLPMNVDCAAGVDDAANARTCQIQTQGRGTGKPFTAVGPDGGLFSPASCRSFWKSAPLESGRGPAPSASPRSCCTGLRSSELSALLWHVVWRPARTGRVETNLLLLIAPAVALPSVSLQLFYPCRLLLWSASSTGPAGHTD